MLLPVVTCWGVAHTDDASFSDAVAAFAVAVAVAKRTCAAVAAMQSWSSWSKSCCCSSSASLSAMSNEAASDVARSLPPSIQFVNRYFIIIKYYFNDTLLFISVQHGALTSGRTGTGCGCGVRVNPGRCILVRVEKLKA